MLATVMLRRQSCQTLGELPSFFEESVENLLSACLDPDG